MRGTVSLLHRLGFRCDACREGFYDAFRIGDEKPAACCGGMGNVFADIGLHFASLIAGIDINWKTMCRFDLALCGFILELPLIVEQAQGFPIDQEAMAACGLE
jgi:hypothetical protein